MYDNLQICADIAEKVKDPSAVYESLRDLPEPYTYLSENWPNLSLADGVSSIITLFALLDEIYPDQGWDEKGNTYIKLCVSQIEANGINGFSLFGGLAGVCYAVFLSSKNGTRYQQLLSKLDQFLVDQLEQSFFKQADQLLRDSNPIPPLLYNFSGGISGVLSYLLMRKDNPTLQKLASDCLYTLIRLLNQKQVVNGIKKPGWYVSQEYHMGDKAQFPNGGFLLDRVNGITGCLSVLSYASLEGMTVSGQFELISEIAEWLKSQKIENDHGPAWPYLIPIEHTVEDDSRDIWNYGAPAVCSSLFLAGKATKNQKLMDFAEESLLKIYAKPWKELNHVGPSFISGRAGLLVIASQMARLTGNPFFQKQIPVLTEDLVRFYSPSHRFGFQTVHYTLEDDQYQWIDHPGLWEGAVGVALSLLMTARNESRDWQTIFLAN